MEVIVIIIIVIIIIMMEGEGHVTIEKPFLLFHLNNIEILLKTSPSILLKPLL